MGCATLVPLPWPLKGSGAAPPEARLGEQRHRSGGAARRTAAHEERRRARSFPAFLCPGNHLAERVQKVYTTDGQWPLSALRSFASSRRRVTMRDSLVSSGYLSVSTFVLVLRLVIGQVLRHASRGRLEVWQSWEGVAESRRRDRTAGSRRTIRAGGRTPESVGRQPPPSLGLGRVCLTNEPHAAETGGSERR